MTFDELWRRSLSREDPLIFSLDNQAEASFFRDSPGESELEDLNETEINRFIGWLESTLLIDDLGKREA